MSRPAPHVVAINGIRTPVASDSWPKRLIPWLEENHRCTGEAHYYRTGAVPPWNLWVVNPRIARVLASSLEARVAEIGPHPIHIVAHSNGTNIAVSLAQALASRGIRVETLSLIGSAIHSDAHRSGLGELVAAGHVRRAVAWCSPDDAVIRPLQGFPGFYGSLGARGWERDGKATGLRVAAWQPLGDEWGTDRIRYVTRWFPGFGHGEYFEGAAKVPTFRCLAGDMGLQVA